MSDLLRALDAFPPPDRSRWRKSVDAALKGRSYDEVLVRTTPEGLRLQPLYTREDLPFATPDPLRQHTGWTRVSQISGPGLADANSQALDDLNGGIERVIFPAGPGAIPITTIDDLTRLTNGIVWSLAPVTITAATDVARANRLFELCAAVRGEAGHGLATQVDVLTLAGADHDDASWLDQLSGPVNDDVIRASGGSLHTADARPLGISTVALRAQGAHGVQELATALCLFAAVLRAFDARGLDPAAAVRACEFHVGIGSDFFGEIAKLRAFRLCLQLALDTAGIGPAHEHALITAWTAPETLARHDVHTNLLRTTAQAAAAAIGGADAITIAPFDRRVAGGSALGRRLARNIHSLLAEESDVAAIADAGAGAFYIERRTEDTAEAAWQLFTEWEQAGGLPAIVSSGTLASAIRTSRVKRSERIRSKQDPILGVSVYPPADAAAAAPPEPDGLPYLDDDVETGEVSGGRA